MKNKDCSGAKNCACALALSWNCLCHISGPNENEQYQTSKLQSQSLKSSHCLTRSCMCLGHSHPKLTDACCNQGTQSSKEGNVGQRSNLQAPDVAISIPKKQGAIQVGAQGGEGGLQEGWGQAQAALSQMTGLQFPCQYLTLNKCATQEISHSVQLLSHLDTRKCCLQRLGQVMLHDETWLDNTAENTHGHVAACTSVHARGGTPV